MDYEIIRGWIWAAFLCSLWGGSLCYAYRIGWFKGNAIAYQEAGKHFR